MKRALIILLLFVGLTSMGQNLYTSISSEVKFFSEATLENIEAINKDVRAILNTETKEIVFAIPIAKFHFDKAMMEEHFNENYMESHKYKVGSFKGTIIEEVDFKKDGTYQVSATGKLNLHGVERERTLKGTLTVKGDVITLDSKFNVLLKDHKIKIVKLLIENIAEEIEVTLNIKFGPKAK